MDSSKAVSDRVLQNLQKPEPPRRHSVNEREPTNVTAGYRILIIDDQEMNHVITKRICVNLFQWVVDKAVTAEEGKASAFSMQYDIILIDFNLDSGNKGNEVARVLREAKTTSLLFSYSSSHVPDENHNGKSLWDDHLDKNDIPSAIDKLHKVLLSRQLKSLNLS